MTDYRRLVVCEDHPSRREFFHLEIPQAAKSEWANFRWVLEVEPFGTVITEYRVITTMRDAHTVAGMEYRCIDYRSDPDEEIRAFLAARVRWVIR